MLPVKNYSVIYNYHFQSITLSYLYSMNLILLEPISVAVDHLPVFLFYKNNLAIKIVEKQQEK